MGDFVSVGGGGGGVPAELRSLYAKHGQDHVFEYVDKGTLTADEVAALVSQLRTIDPARMNQLAGMHVCIFVLCSGFCVFVVCRQPPRIFGPAPVTYGRPSM